MGVQTFSPLVRNEVLYSAVLSGDMTQAADVCARDMSCELDLERPPGSQLFRSLSFSGPRVGLPLLDWREFGLRSVGVETTRGESEGSLRLVRGWAELLRPRGSDDCGGAFLGCRRFGCCCCCSLSDELLLGLSRVFLRRGGEACVSVTDGTGGEGCGGGTAGAAADGCGGLLFLGGAFFNMDGGDGEKAPGCGGEGG